MPSSQSSMYFRECVEEVELTDLQCDGLFMTWSNKRSLGFLAKKLDRFLVNDCWLDAFQNIRASFSPLNFSDHCIGMLSATGHHWKCGSFKFFNFLTRHSSFLPIVT